MTTSKASVCWVVGGLTKPETMRTNSSPLFDRAYPESTTTILLKRTLTSLAATERS